MLVSNLGIVKPAPRRVAAPVAQTPPLPADGVWFTGDAARDWAALRSGKNVYKVYIKGKTGDRIHPRPIYGLSRPWDPFYFTPSPASSPEEMLERMRIEEAKASGGLFSRQSALKVARAVAVGPVSVVPAALGVKAPTREQALKAGRAAAIAAAAYYAAPYLLTAGAKEAVVSAAEQRAKELALKKLMPKQPEALAPEPALSVETAPASSYQPAPKPPAAKAAVLSLSALLPFLFLL